MRDVNLIPYDLVIREEAYRRVRVWFVGCVGVCLLMATSFLIQRHIVTTIDEEVQKLEERNAVLKARYQEVKNLQLKQKELARKAGVMNLLISKRNFTQYFIELERCMTDSVRLTYLDLDKKNLSLTDSAEEEWVETGYFVVKKTGSQDKNRTTASKGSPDFILEGNALNHDALVRFISALANSTLFYDVNLKRCSESEGTKAGMVSFEIDAYLQR